MDPAWEWHVGDPIGFGNDVGAPEVPYMSYGPKVKDEEEEIEEESQSRQLMLDSSKISDEAWKLYGEHRYDEALIFINRALEYWDARAIDWNRKGLILNALSRYDEALECFDEAIGISSNESYVHNRALCLVDYANVLWLGQDGRMAMDKITEALEILQGTDDKGSEAGAWNLKGMIHKSFGDVSEAFSCFKKAMELAGNDNCFKEIYRQNMNSMLEMIGDEEITCPRCGNLLKVTDNFCLRCGIHIDVEVKPQEEDFTGTVPPSDDNPEPTDFFDDDEEPVTVEYTDDEDALKLRSIGRENLITIAATGIYSLEDKLCEGTDLRLVKEPDNVDDTDAIAVYLDDDQVGYVSNIPLTNSPFSSMACELKDLPDECRGQYLLQYGRRYHIARIFRHER